MSDSSQNLVSTSSPLPTQSGTSLRKSLIILLSILASGWLIATLVITVRADRVGFDSKTLWDWLDLLIVPAILAVGVWWLNRNEQISEQRQADRRQQTEWALEDRRASVEREISIDGQNQMLLNQFLDRMSSLLLEGGLEDSTEQNTIRVVARARTLAVLTSLDSFRRSQVIRFLVETKIVGARGIVDISGSNLSGADLRGINLSNTNLDGVDLSRANLTEAELNGASLQGADLSNALLIGTRLNKATLGNASLRDSLLIGSVLDGANLKRVDLIGADLTGASLVATDLRGSDLRNTKLNWANFSNSQLGWTDLSEGSLVGTKLDGANFDKAFLTNTDMSYATVSDQQLHQMKSFEGSIMPDGRPYQQWIETGRWVLTDTGPDAEIIANQAQ